MPCRYFRLSAQSRLIKPAPSLHAPLERLLLPCSQIDHVWFWISRECAANLALDNLLPLVTKALKW